MVTNVSEEAVAPVAAELSVIVLVMATAVGEVVVVLQSRLPHKHAVSLNLLLSEK